MMYSTLLFKRIGNSLRANLLRDFSRKQNLYWVSSLCINRPDFGTALTRSNSTNPPAVEFEVQEFKDDPPGAALTYLCS